MGTGKIISLLGILALLSACGDIDLAENQRPFKQVTLSVKTYCPQENYELLSMSLVNLSAINQASNLQIDTDRDFLSDIDEAKNIDIYNTDRQSKFSNAINYSDFFAVMVLGKEASSVNIQDCIVAQDTDNDLIDDCEEEYLGLDKTNPDTDGDLIPDGIEYRHHLNANDPNDAILDLDGDGLNNLEEILLGTDINIANDAFQDLVKLDYNIEPYENSPCQSIQINNISLVNAENGNLLHLYVLEKNNEEKINIRYIQLLVSKKLLPGYEIKVDSVENQKITINSDGEV